MVVKTIIETIFGDFSSISNVLAIFTCLNGFETIKSTFYVENQGRKLYCLDFQYIWDLETWFGLLTSRILYQRANTVQMSKTINTHFNLDAHQTQVNTKNHDNKVSYSNFRTQTPYHPQHSIPNWYKNRLFSNISKNTSLNLSWNIVSRPKFCVEFEFQSPRTLY